MWAGLAIPSSGARESVERRRWLARCLSPSLEPSRQRAQSEARTRILRLGQRFIMYKPRALLIVAATICTTLVCHLEAQEPQGGTDAFSQLKFRFIGPPGNRLDAIVGVPGNPFVYYAGAASGGIFKTSDGGAHWDPIFDSQSVSSIGALAVAPSDPNIVWAGTGESFIRSNISVGTGIYKSLDAGKSWAQVGLEKTGRIGRIVIDP